MLDWINPNQISFDACVENFLHQRDTPRKFLERCLEVIDKKEPKVKAFVYLNLPAARRAADQSTKRYRAGKPLSVVDGCPIAIKDIISTQDMPTQMNNPVFKGWQSGQDAACVAALRQGGAVMLGKSVTTEFAIGYSGPTTNPFDASRTPGGSSSGSAAAVGSGMVPVALGTQTQASTLRPASYCGAVGYKSSWGQFHMGGIHPLSATADHLGIIGATLGDVWRVASQISLGIGSPGQPFLREAGAKLPAARKPKKLVRLYTHGWGEIDPHTEEAFESAVEVLAKRGVKIVSRHSHVGIARLEERLMQSVAQSLDIVAYELRWPYQDYIAQHGKLIGERLRGLVKKAQQMTPKDYEALLQTRETLRKLWADVLGDADGCLSLAASGPAPRGLEYTGSRSFLVYASWLGLPAFSLPVMQSQGLPLGLQLIGQPGVDASLAAVAHWVMQ